MYSVAKNIAKYCGFFLLFFILMSGSIRGVHPFAFGMLFALIWCGQKVYILAPLYILSGFLVFGTLGQVIVDCVTSGVILIAYFLHYKFNKPLNHILIGCYAFLSQFGLLYISSGSPEMLWSAMLTLTLGLICLYAYLNLFQNILLKGIRRKYGIDEVICFGVLIFALSAGLGCLPFASYYVFGIITLLLLLSNNILGVSASMLGSIFLGLGLSFVSGNFLYLSHIIFMNLFVALTQSDKRLFPALVVAFVDAISGLYFLNNYTLWHFVSVVAGSVIFLCIPSKILRVTRNVVLTDKEDYAVRTLINKNRKNLCNRLYDLGDVFLELQKVFSKMITSNRDFDKSIPYLVTEVRRQHCSACPNRGKCLGLNESINDAISNMLMYCYQRGKVSLIDVPPVLTTNCIRLTLLIGSVNMLINEYKSNIQSDNNLNSGRRLLAEQMSGIAEIIQSLAKEMGVEVSFDTELEKRLREELLYAGVQCSEVVFYEVPKELFQVTLVIKKKDTANPSIEQVVGKLLGVKMEIDSIVDDAKPTYSVVTLKKANNYDIIFGSANRTKAGNTLSGDTHSVLKIGKSKVLLSLCDGMGSGEQAQKTSTLALNMIESFYKAGFDSNLILRSTNQLLTLNDEERFSAIDICVIDLENGTCDIIKVGSPPSFIKNGTDIKQVNCNALPLGILEELKPSISSIILCDNDMVVLATDGVVDSFDSIENLRKLVAECDDSNPQEVANTLLRVAIENNQNYPKDDMTVLVGKIFSKV